MAGVFKKLNYKGHKTVHVIGAPKEFTPLLSELDPEAKVQSSIGSKTISFFIGFVTTQKGVDDLAKKAAPLLEQDAVFWFAYPKGTSKRYKCEFNRDNGWNTLAELGFEPVRMVAIDEDWSALRFRKPEHIKTMTRSFARSEEGKAKIAEGKKKSR